MFEIVFAIVLFTAIVLALTALVLLARSLLIPSGEVALTVNETRTIKAPAGAKLLGALADAGIQLPSACGGVGTCGLCRVQLLDETRTALPTEVARLTRTEAAEGVRLACQVVIREDMRIRVADEILGAEEWQCTVRSNKNLATLIKELVLALPEGRWMEHRAGAFVQITCPPYRAKFTDFDIDPAYRDVWDELGLWRYEAGTNKPVTRAYSMANYPEEKGVIILDIRIALPPPGAPESAPPGVVSSYLFNLQPGDAVTVSGPFGHFFATETDREMVFVGGGVGMAPMRAHIFDQLKRLGTKRKITFWYGARSLRELFYADTFDRLEREHENFKWVVALSEPRPEDDWDGHTGFIHDVLYETYLKDHPAPEECEYYLCGPPMMIKAVMAMLDNLGVEGDSIMYDDFGG